MNRTEYIKELEKRLKYIPKEDREDAIEYYTELMSDMEVDENEDVTARLGTAKDAAKKILDECTQKHVDEYEENKTVKGHATVVWLSVLGLLSLPISLPLGIAVLAVAVSLIIVVLALIITAAVTAAALVISGAASLIFAWTAPGIAQKAVVFGLGLCTLALGVLLGLGVYFLTRLIVNKIFRRDSVKNVEEN
ncbi:MAG: DUF1700 domain-containing protein [Lachnospiraceae bacterium]|nr:DUF1700 domain-containing protein [Lachnospiraceae bacterium]